MTNRRDERTGAPAGADQKPYMPGEEAKKKGEIPTGETRNEDYGQGRKSGVVADEKAQEDELATNERNR